MHNVERSWIRWPIAVLGTAAWLVFLGVSMFANYRYGFTVTRTEQDGQIYGAAFAAGDVLMALSPCFFFAAIANWREHPGRALTQAFFSLVLWAATTVVAFQAAVSHASVNRLDAASARTTTATSYADTRKELEQARKDRGFIPEHRPADTVRAELEKHKTSRIWNATSECQEKVNKPQREFCQAYHTLNAELGYATSAARLDQRIEQLTAKSDKLTETSGTVVGSEADAGASTWARFFKIDLRDMQSIITFAIAGVIWLGASLGLYCVLAMFGSNRMVVLDAVAVESDPQPLTPAGAKALPPPSAPPKVTRPEPSSEARALLDAIGWPAKRPRTLQARDSRDALPWRFLAWLAAHKLDGEEYESPRFEALYAEMATTENREPWAWRIVGKEMWTHPKWGGNKLGKLGCAKRERPEADGRTRTYFIVQKLPPPVKLLEQLAKRGFKPAASGAPPEPPPSGGNVHRLPLPPGAGALNSPAPKISGDNRPEPPPSVARARLRFPLAWGST